MKTLLTTTILFLATFSFGKDESFVQEKFVHARNSTLSFTRNDGQIDTRGKADCRFSTSVGGANYFFCADGIVADFQKRVNDEQNHVARVSNPQTDSGLLTRATKVSGHVLKLNFLARTNFLADIQGQDEQEYKCNYFIGNDAAKWHTSVPNYSRIVYNNVWQGIDVAYYGAANDLSPSHVSDGGHLGGDGLHQLKYDVIVHPGANPNQIQFAYEGQDALSVDSKGNLVLKTSVGEVIEQTPYVYQIINGGKKEIPSSFIIQRSPPEADAPLKQAFSIQVGLYDPTHELIIDPAYSTYLGGTGQDEGNAIAVDAEGNAYVMGSTSSSNFPRTTGAYDTSRPGSAGYSVTKINASGSALIYSTYLSGGGESGLNLVLHGNAIAVDGAGNAFITGSANVGFPIFPTTQGAFQTTGGGGIDAFVTKLDATGSSLIYSTYLGGSGQDRGYAIVIDSSGSAYVTGSTQSKNFPTTVGAYQPVIKGTQDVFVTKINAAGSAPLMYSTFLGGAVGSPNLNTAISYSLSIAIDRNGNAYVTGTTSCYDFPTTQGAYLQSPSMSGGSFVTKLQLAGNSINDLLYSTRMDGNCLGIAVDSAGNAFITGNAGAGFRTTPGAFQTTCGGGQDPFVAKLKPAGQGINDLLYSSFLGGANNEYGNAIAVDGAGNAYITGYMVGGGNDAFVAKLKPAGQGTNDLLYSTYLGGSGNGALGVDVGIGIAVDVGGNAFITGTTRSITFPTTVGAFQTTYGGGYSDAFVTKFGLNPEILTIDSLDMGRVMCDPAQKTFVVYNRSEILLRIDSIKIVDTTNFTIISQETFPVEILPNSSAQITINFKVGTPGNKTTTLKIYSNDHTPLADSVKKITLVGVVDPKNRFLTLSTTKLDFGSIACDSSASDFKIIVYDTSNTSLQIKPTIGGSVAYTITPSDTTIDVGDSAVFAVHFQPITGGQHNAKLWFALSQCSQLDTIALTGIKNSSISFTALPHTLEYFSCDQKEVDSVISIKNTGSSPLTLDSGVVNGLGFSLVSPQGKVTVAPGDSIKYVIRFTSQQLDEYTGTFTVSGPCQAISQHDLVGWKTSLLVAPHSIDFGGLSCSTQYRDTSVTVTSKGGQAIVTANTVDGGFSVLTSSTIIKADSSKDFRIRFKPDSAGTFHGKLIFTTSICPGIQDTVDLVGAKASTTCLSADPKVLQFDTLSCEASGGNEEESIISLCNCSTSQITLDSAHVAGINFTLVSPLGKKTVAAGLCQDYTIRFSPSGPGTYTGTFTIHGMPCYISYSVPLQGVCKAAVSVSMEKELPLEFSLDQNHPNPFSRFTIVSCRLSMDGSFEVRDMLGRVVYQTHVNKSSTEVTIDASMLPNGLYLYSLGDGKNIQSRMMMVVH